MTDLKFKTGKFYITKGCEKAMCVDSDNLLFYHGHLNLSDSVLKHLPSGKLFDAVNEDLNITGEWEDPKVFQRFLSVNSEGIGYIDTDCNSSDLKHNIPIKIIIPEIGKATVETLQND